MKQEISRRTILGMVSTGTVLSTIPSAQGNNNISNTYQKTIDDDSRVHDIPYNILVSNKRDSSMEMSLSVLRWDQDSGIGEQVFNRNYSLGANATENRTDKDTSNVDVGGPDLYAIEVHTDRSESKVYEGWAVPSRRIPDNQALNVYLEDSTIRISPIIA